MSAPRSESSLGPVSLIEEGSQLLRGLPATVLATYAIGTLPFVLGLLFFWSDMSRSALAPRHCSAGALGLALLFVWMKAWQAVFCRQISARLTAQAPSPWTVAHLLRMFARQSLLQATGFILLPLAVLFTVPAAWVYAFYQNLSVLEDGGTESTGALVRTAWQQAVIAPRQNHLMLLIMGGFGLFVFLNSVMVLALVPVLIKKFFGLDTVFTLSGIWGFTNTTFLAAAVALSHVCLDPLVKTLYTLRCFYGRSLKTGEDLRARLTRLRRAAPPLAVVTLLMLVPLVAPATSLGAGRETVTPVVQSAPVQPEDLEAAIDRVLTQPRYTWRLPREPGVEAKANHDGRWASFIGWLEEPVKAFLDFIWRWLERIMKWLGSRTPEASDPEKGDGHGPDLMKGLIILAGAMLVLFLLLAVRNHYQQRPAGAAHPPASPDVSVPDLQDEHIRVDALPTDEWLALAEKLAGEGQFRLAMRACFFSTLSVLANRQIIMIADYKSNREYESELVRRASDRPALGAAFQWSVAQLDRALYGMRAVPRDAFTQFAGRQKEIVHLAEG